MTAGLLARILRHGSARPRLLCAAGRGLLPTDEQFSKGAHMTIRRRDIGAVGVAAATLAAVSIVPARAQSKTESTWDLIKRTGKVRMGIFDYPPYFLRDKASGEWVGAMVEMGKDIAKELDVKLELVEVGGFGEAVLSLQAGQGGKKYSLAAHHQSAPPAAFPRPDRLVGGGSGHEPQQ